MSLNGKWMKKNCRVEYTIMNIWNAKSKAIILYILWFAVQTLTLEWWWWIVCSCSGSWFYSDSSVAFMFYFWWWMYYVFMLCCVEASLKLFKRFSSRTYKDINLNRTDDALDHVMEIIEYSPLFGIYELKLGIYCRFGIKSIRFVIYWITHLKYYAPFLQLADYNICGRMTEPTREKGLR